MRRDVAYASRVGRALLVTLAAATAWALAAAPAHSVPTYSKANATLFDWLPPLVAGGAAASPDGSLLYVTGTVDNRVTVYSTASGSVLFTFGSTGTGPGRFRRPQGIAVDPYGDVYVADAGNGRVQRFSRIGVFRGAWDSPFARGVAAGPAGSVFVLSALGNVVSRRSYSGKDLGAWPVMFARGFDEYGLYGPARTGATAGLVADRGGDVVVSGDVVQDRGAKERGCKESPNYGLRPLPLVLQAPAVGRFTPDGASVAANSVTVPRGWIGAPCYTGSGAGFDSYAGSGRTTTAFGLGIDPALRDIYVALREGQDLHWISRILPGRDAASNSGPDGGVLGIPSGRPPFKDDGASTRDFGRIRALTIDCRRRMYAVLDRRTVVYRAAVSSYVPDCRVRNRWVVLGAAAVGPRTSRSETPARALVRVTCPPGRTCRGDLSVTVRPVKCRTCRGITLTAPFRVSGGRDAVVKVPLGGRARSLIAGGASSVVRGRAAGGVGVAASPAAVPLRVPSTLSASCQAGPTATAAAAGLATISGRLLPAVAGRRVTLVAVGPDGTLVRRTAPTRRDGRYEAQITLPASGAWTVRAVGSADAAHNGSEAACAALTPGTLSTLAPLPFESGDLATAPPGGTPPPPAGPVPPTLTLNCSRLPGGGPIRGSGALQPGVTGSQVTVRAEPQDPATGLPAREATVATSADGSYTADLDVPPGAYRLSTRFTGDLARSAAEAGPCEVPA